MKTALSRKFLAAISLVTTASVVSTVIAQAIYEPSAAITVTSSADAGGTCPGPTCTLRQAIATAVAGNAIGFAAGIKTITLTSAELLLDKNITITGPGANLLTIERDPGAVSFFRIFNIPAGKTITIRGLTISKGQLPNSCCNSGGGILSDSSNLTVIGCAFVGNRAFTRGGGIYSWSRISSATLTVIDCFFGGNTGVEGGAIYSDGSFSGNATMMINNSTFSGNRATLTGGPGCVYNDGSQSGTANAQISNSTFNDTLGTANIVNLGNGLGHATLDIGNTILSRSGSLQVGNLINNTGTVVSHGYDLADDNASGALVSFGDQPNTEPMLGPLRDNGGPTLTLAPAINSPAIDQGKRNSIPALASNFDQRGLIRPVDYSTVPNAAGGDGSDIGALELQAPSSVSRKTHDGAPFDIDLPLTGTAGVECRIGNVSGSHQVIATFPSPVTVTSASVTAGTGNVSNFTVSGGQVTVNLAGVADAQIVAFTLFGVNDGSTTSNYIIPMGILLGDTNEDNVVNTGDSTQTRNRSGQPTNETNFRSDVNADGFVNSGDTLVVRGHSGMTLP